MSDEDMSRELWVYLGPHHKPGTFLWRDPAGQRLAYSKLKARVFGGIYSVQVDRNSGDNIRVYPEATFTGDMAEDAASIQVTAVESETLAAATRLERSTSRTATVDAALAPLLELAASMKTESERYALSRLVTSRIIAARPRSK